jgi:hypothetical protein
MRLGIKEFFRFSFYGMTGHSQARFKKWMITILISSKNFVSAFCYAWLGFAWHGSAGQGKAAHGKV